MLSVVSSPCPHVPPLPQLAKALGLFVVGICGTKNVDFVKGLGADEVRQKSTGLCWFLAKISSGQGPLAAGLCSGVAPQYLPCCLFSSAARGHVCAVCWPCTKLQTCATRSSPPNFCPAGGGLQQPERGRPVQGEWSHLMNCTARVHCAVSGWQLGSRNQPGSLSTRGTMHFQAALEGHWLSYLFPVSLQDAPFDIAVDCMGTRSECRWECCGSMSGLKLQDADRQEHPLSLLCTNCTPCLPTLHPCSHSAAPWVPPAGALLQAMLSVTKPSGHLSHIFNVSAEWGHGSLPSGLADPGPVRHLYVMCTTHDPYPFAAIC